MLYEGVVKCNCLLSVFVGCSILARVASWSGSTSSSSCPFVCVGVCSGTCYELQWRISSARRACEISYFWLIFVFVEVRLSAPHPLPLPTPVYAWCRTSRGCCACEISYFRFVFVCYTTTTATTTINYYATTATTTTTSTTTTAYQVPAWLPELSGWLPLCMPLAVQGWAKGSLTPFR